MPALELDDGDILTECAIMLQWISDQVPNKKSMPELGTRERYHVMALMNYIGMEVQKNFITPERYGGVWANFLSKTQEG